MVERQLPKLDVASSSLVSRLLYARIVLCLLGQDRSWAFSTGAHRLCFWSRTQMVKGAVCKTAITSSILVGSFLSSPGVPALLHRLARPELHPQTAA